MSEFVDHYNNDHQHSGIKFVIPQQAMSGEHVELLVKLREAVVGSNANLHQDFCISGRCRDFRSSIRHINYPTNKSGGDKSKGGRREVA